MKKIVSVMFAGLLLIPMVANADNSSKQFRLQDKAHNSALMRSDRTAFSVAMNPATRAESESGFKVTDVIETPPEGKVMKADRSGLCFTTTFDGVSLLEYDNSPGEIVECENGDVYVQMPLFGFPMYTYIVGHREGNEVTFQLPQTVFMTDYGNGTYDYYNATLGQFNGSSSFLAPNSESAKEFRLPEMAEEDNKIVMTVDENGVYRYESGLTIEDGVLNVEYGDVVLSLCDPVTGKWCGYSEVYSTWAPFTGELITPPSDLATETMGFTYNGLGHYVEVGFDADDIYIKGMVQDFPEAWIKGSVDGEIISFPSAQYLGENVRYAAYCYFASATYEPSGYMGYLDTVECYYDAESKTITAPENVALLYNGASDYIHFIDMYQNAMIRPQVDSPALTLNAPFNIQYIDGNYASVIFNYSFLNQEDYILDVNKLYFKMYVDGEEFVFTPDEYFLLEKDMTYVPVMFEDYYDFMIESPGSMRVGIYFQDFESIGFKLFYIEGDISGDNYEVLGESDMALYEYTEVKEISDSIGFGVADVKYYDLMGNPCSRDYKGIVIKVLKYSDGTTKSIKTIRK